MAKYPNTNGMKQSHWDALQTYAKGSFKWDGQKLQWRVEDQNRFVYYGKTLIQAVEQMVAENPKWRRYRFYTKSVEDYRPLVFNPKFPWWCSAEAGDDSSATIVAWLPVTEDLLKYWDDAFDVEFTEHHEIEFTSRFAKPDYFVQ